MATALITGRTRSGQEWIPRFVVALNATRCIGCGRCFKSCPRSVFTLIERPQNDDDDDCDDDAEDTKKVMSIVNAFDCIGCQSCARVCPKGCLTHEAFPLPD